jgi:hypothetical protein
MLLGKVRIRRGGVVESVMMEMALITIIQEREGNLATNNSRFHGSFQVHKDELKIHLTFLPLLTLLNYKYLWMNS